MVEFTPTNTTPYSFKYKIKSRLWSLVNSTFFRWTPFFFRRTRICMLRLFGAKVDWTCGISSHAKIIDPWNLSMGAHSSIGEDCCIRCRDKVIIGKNCCISRGVDILTASHDVSSSTFEMITKPVVIENNCWIATKSTLEKGIIIGEGGVVAACSNVVKDVAPWTIVGGNPAKCIKQRTLKKQTNNTNPTL